LDSESATVWGFSNSKETLKYDRLTWINLIGKFLYQTDKSKDVQKEGDPDHFETPDKDHFETQTDKDHFETQTPRIRIILKHIQDTAV
jgi:hypothetical protein